VLQALIRPGADTANVTASFEVGADHPVRGWLAGKGLELAAGEQLVFRRTLKRGGTARAFLNDQPVSAGLLEEAGNLLADHQISQHEEQGLLNAGHRALIDAYAKADGLLIEVGQAWTKWQCARRRRSRWKLASHERRPAQLS
jgi:DNA repair protein RecN (Recombination protein N)